MKRPIYQKGFVPFHYNDLARIYHVRRRIYPTGSKIGRLLRIPLFYFALMKLGGKRRSFGRVYRRQLAPSFFRRYDRDFKIRRTKDRYNFNGRRNKYNFFIPLLGNPRHKRRKPPLRRRTSPKRKRVMYSNKRLVRRPTVRKTVFKKPGRRVVKKTVIRKGKTRFRGRGKGRKRK